MAPKGEFALHGKHTPRGGARSWRRPDAGMNIVKDITGTLSGSQEFREPFALTNSDFEIMVLLLTDVPAIHLSLQAPSGQILTPENASAHGVHYCGTGGTLGYRFRLPLERLPAGGAGTWKAILSLDEAEAGGEEVDYTLSVVAWSNLRLRASIAQERVEGESHFTLRALLDENSAPIGHRAGVHAELTRPDGTNGILVFHRSAPGLFETSLTTSVPGDYRFDIVASGIASSGFAFTRQELLTGIVRRSRQIAYRRGPASDVIKSPANDDTTPPRSLFWVCGGAVAAGAAAQS